VSTHSEVSEPVNGRTQEETVWPVAKSDRASWTEKRNGLEEQPLSRFQMN